jgi:hypothetical protein
MTPPFYPRVSSDTPEPVDWQAWNDAHPLKTAPAPTPMLSRLQRERMEKKMRKGTLRAAA